MHSLRIFLNILFVAGVLIWGDGCAAGLPTPEGTNEEITQRALRRCNDLEQFQAFGDCLLARGNERITVSIGVRYGVGSLALIEFSSMFGAIAVVKCDSTGYELSMGETILRGNPDQPISELQSQLDYPFSGRQLLRLVTGRSIDDQWLKMDSVWIDHDLLEAELSADNRRESVSINVRTSLIHKRISTIPAGNIQQMYDHRGLLRQVTFSSGNHDSLNISYQHVSGSFKQE